MKIKIKEEFDTFIACAQVNTNQNLGQIDKIFAGIPSYAALLQFHQYLSFANHEGETPKQYVDEILKLSDALTLNDETKEVLIAILNKS